MSSRDRARVLRLIGSVGSALLLGWIAVVIARAEHDPVILTVVAGAAFVSMLVPPLPLMTFLPRWLVVTRGWFVLSSTCAVVSCLAYAIAFVAIEHSTSSTAGLMLFYPMILAWGCVAIVRGSAERLLNRPTPPRPDR